MDIDWLIEHTHPDIEIAQLAELPDPHTHHGREGFSDALLDWPRQWNDFGITPHRIFSPCDRLTNWDMLLTLEEALSRAAERRADRDDDHAAQGDSRERA